MQTPDATRGKLFTISAPSGAGKTSLVKALIEANRDIQVSISHTTRPMRPGESDGVNYHFVRHDEFERMIHAGDFLEYAKVFDNYYGTAKSWVERSLKQGSHVVLEIDWQGARQVKSLLPDTVAIFILPPSLATLRERLTKRGQDEASVINRRMAEAVNEMSHYGDADFLIINDDFDAALDALTRVIRDHQADFSLARQTSRHRQLLQDLLR